MKWRFLFLFVLFLFIQCNNKKHSINNEKNLFKQIIDIKQHQNDFKNFIKNEKINPDSVQIKINNFSENHVKNIFDKIYFFDIQYNYEGNDWTAEAYRLIGVALNDYNKKTYFYDSKIYMPECGWDFFKSLGNLYSLEINGNTLLIFNEINKSVICDDTKEKTITRFYNVAKNYKKIYELETKYVNYGYDSNSKPSEFKSVLVYPNMCGFDCKAITFWFLKNNKIVETKTLTVNNSGDGLIPY